MQVAVQKRFDLNPTAAREKVGSGLNQARLRARNRLRVSQCFQLNIS